MLTVFRHSIEAIENDSSIVCSEGNFWYFSRAAQQFDSRFVEAQPLPPLLWVLLHQVRPKHVEKNLAAIEVLRPHIRLPFARLRDNLVLGSGLL
ncbi:hypothetical protein [uncultured Actinomyces sp.]|uniref:hypothetical protein n=1 Tax=uncultured Actinomyces sp. TaxID=249061 RepID=UPI0028D59CC0|nr:hypothetical protein [uncultured Actinomyces sp.]